MAPVSRTGAVNSHSLGAAGDATAELDNRAVASGVVQCPEKPSEWIEIELLDDTGRAVKDMACTVIDPDGQEHKGKTDSYGVLRIDGISKGDCTLELPTIDEDEWGPKEMIEWVVIELLDDEGRPVEDMACTIIDPDGTEHKGKTDSSGLLEINGISGGECRLTFPTIDGDAWESAPR